MIIEPCSLGTIAFKVQSKIWFYFFYGYFDHKEHKLQEKAGFWWSGNWTWDTDLQKSKIYPNWTKRDQNQVWVLSLFGWFDYRKLELEKWGCQNCKKNRSTIHTLNIHKITFTEHFLLLLRYNLHKTFNSLYIKFYWYILTQIVVFIPNIILLYKYFTIRDILYKKGLL